jgi:hypothetical protein
MIDETKRHRYTELRYICLKKYTMKTLTRRHGVEENRCNRRFHPPPTASRRELQQFRGLLDLALKPSRRTRRNVCVSGLHRIRAIRLIVAFGSDSLLSQLGEHS